MSGEGKLASSNLFEDQGPADASMKAALRCKATGQAHHLGTVRLHGEFRTLLFRRVTCHLHPSPSSRRRKTQILALSEGGTCCLVAGEDQWNRGSITMSPSETAPALLRHSNPSTTMRIDQQTVAEERRSAQAVAFNSLMGGRASEP